ncbi:MAG: DUF2934 domain-containing protein [Gammaproteobacteria bacterium]
MDVNSVDFDDAKFQSVADRARHHWISVTACFKAEARGFAPGFERDDWLAAEQEYAQMLIAGYLSMVEEDGIMTMVSLRQLAEAIGVPNSDRMTIKADLIRAIQSLSRMRACFQVEPGSPPASKRLKAANENWNASG